MGFRDSFWNSFLRVEEYEAIGLCYQELEHIYPELDLQFLGVIQEIEDAHDANAIVFKELYGSISRITQKAVEDNSSFRSYSKELYETIITSAVPKEYFGSDGYAIVIFYILEALNIYILSINQGIDYFVEPSTTGHGPKNDGESIEDCLVYLKVNHSFLSGVYEHKEEEKSFRGQLNAESLGDCFLAVQIIPRRYLTSRNVTPCILPIRLSNDELRKRIYKDKKIRIASIPFIGRETFHFHEVGKEEYCNDRRELRNRFYIDYICSSEEEEDKCRVAVQLLASAIKQQANFVVFPEYIMDLSMRKAIKEFLKNCPEESKKQLILVFAGTTYEFVHPRTGNNVLYIINAHGTEVSRYYKYSPFHIKDMQDDLEERTGIFHLRNLELLSNPGLKCSLFDIEGIGRILPSVCRDVVDGKYTTNLVRLFSPQLLFISAWSSSVASFDTFLSDYANTMHTASLLCNCCNAVNSCKLCKKQVPIGSFCLPQKVNTVMAATPQKILRSHECCGNNCDRDGCFFIIDIDYSKDFPQFEIREAVYSEHTNGKMCHLSNL